MKKFFGLMALFIFSLLSVSLVSAIDPGNLSWAVRVNDEYVYFGDTVALVGTPAVEEVVSAQYPNGNPSVSVDEGNTIDVDVTLLAGTAAVRDVEVSAELYGYEHSRKASLQDTTGLFDLSANSQKTVKLQIELPKKLEKQVYWLYIDVANSNSDRVTQIVKLNVEPVRHGVSIADVTFSPSETVKAGRSLMATVLVENYGDNTEDDVKVTMAIPELGLKEAKYVNAQTDNHNVDYEDVPEMWLPIPVDAKEGTYDVVVTVDYNDLEDSVSKTYSIKIVANEQFQTGTQLVMAVAPELNSVAAGKTATFALALTNAGTQSKAYVIEATSGDWATTSLSQNLVVLAPGQNQIVYVDVAASAAALAGEHSTSVVVKSGADALQTVNLRTVVVQASTAVAPAAGVDFNLRNGLEIALIILVVILVIIGLIIGFSRLRKDDTEGDQKYY